MNNPMAPSETIHVVDRIEGDHVVLVPDDPPPHGSDPQLVLRRSQLPPVAECDVLRVPAGPGGTPDWSSAIVDFDLREERLRDAEARLARLRKRDPGGDITL